MSSYTTRRILGEAEQRMTIPQSCGIPQADRAEIARVIDFMIAHDYQAWPDDADPALVAMIRRLNDSV